MKKLGLLILIISIFLVSFIFIQADSSTGINNNSENDSDKTVCCESYGLGSMMVECCQEYKWMNADKCATPAGLIGGGKRIVDDKNCIIKNKNKLKIKEWLKNDTDCPNNCTCTGSVMKCWLNEQREMTVTAGKSGNIIVQIKEEKIITNVTLYKAEDGKIYRITKNNETKEIKVLPEQIKEKIKEKTVAKIQNQSIELDDDGIYHINAEKRVKILWLFPANEKSEWKVDSQTGEIIKTKTKWWGFLAKDEIDNIVGATCGTVSPDSRDECCISKGFEYYKQETGECLNKAG